MQLISASPKHRAWHTPAGMPNETVSLPSKVFKVELRGKGSVGDLWVSGHLDPPCFSFTLGVSLLTFTAGCCVSLRFFFMVVVQISQILHLT